MVRGFMKSEVIIGTDLKEASNNCLEVGLSWAHFLKALPIVLHVHPSHLNDSAAFLVDDKLESQFRALSQKIEEELQRKLEQQIIPFVKDSQRIKTKIRFGDRAKALVHRSVEKESKLIVLGWDDDLKTEKLWMASTIDRVIRASYSPVLVVKEKKAIEPKQILFPFLLNLEFVDTLAWLRILTEQFQSTVTLFHITKKDFSKTDYEGVELLEYLYPEKEDELDYLKAFVKDIKGLGGNLVFNIITKKGSEEKQILEHIEKAQPDLTVLATESKKGIERLYLGSTTEAVLKLTNSSVFVAKLIK